MHRNFVDLPFGEICAVCPNIKITVEKGCNGRIENTRNSIYCEHEKHCQWLAYSLGAYMHGTGGDMVGLDPFNRDYKGDCSDYD